MRKTFPQTPIIISEIKPGSSDETSKNIYKLIKHFVPLHHNLMVAIETVFTRILIDKTFWVLKVSLKST